MSKANGTAASQAHAPEKPGNAEQVHAHSYPGKKAPKPEKVGAPAHNAKALAAGRGNSMGASAGGSHKGFPSSHDYIGHEGYDTSKEAGITSPEGPMAHPGHDGAALAAGRKNSMGVSADGSHKGVPTSLEQIKQ